MSKQKGFTLIELMIVVAIIGILGSIGYSSYQNHMVDARRDAVASRLLQISQKQEKYYLDNQTYSDSLSALGIGTSASLSKSYTITVSTTNDDQNYQFKATVVADGPQKSEAKSSCKELTLDDKGRRLPRTCWGL